MFLLTDVSLRDERPAKRRKIESANGGQVQHGVIVELQQQQLLHPFSCYICNQPISASRSFSCTSCRRTCCERCTGQCDADALSLADIRAATPPLDYDEEDDSLSSPSSPTPTRERIATPDPDANVLRARLSLAARSLSANSLLLQKKRKRRDGANNSNASFNTNGTASNAHGTGRHLSLSHAAYSGVSDMDVMMGVMMDAQLAPVAPAASRHHHHPTQYNQQTPPATFRYTALRASTTDSGLAGYQGCSSKLCSQCLVSTAEGHKICIDCLEESLTS